MTVKVTIAHVGSGTAAVSEMLTEYIKDGITDIRIVETFDEGTGSHYGLHVDSITIDDFRAEPVLDKKPSWQQLNKGCKSKKQRRSINGY